MEMLLSSNNSNGGAGGGQKCIVNNRMGPFTVLYTLIFIISLIGNLLSVWAFILSSRALILKDLGAAPWSLMVFHCQATSITIYISLYASIAFFALIITNCYLQHFNRTSSLRLQDVGFARLLSLVIWLLLLLIMVPNMLLPTQQVPVQQYLSCSSLKKDISLHWHALTVFLCTALFLNASAAVFLSSGLALKRLLSRHSNAELLVETRRVAGSMTAVALAYMLSFVPYHVVRTPYTVTPTKVITNCQMKRQLFLGKESTLLLSVLHICFDPLLFFYLCSPFRQAVRMIFPYSIKQKTNHVELMVQNTTSLQQDVAVAV
ncbi:probable G-protein coupled receptor 171 isoform X3 [Echeneis naucrates]|uniref:probable G-protein coupled receptor 171 isoform X3 n=1 Tax=Echeneis naucrates TaxID=173247 RepID=UPI001113D5BB|nr:probable G-protein coupled receptor 171 isoform X3 [Echeneis naucrates]